MGATLCVESEMFVDVCRIHADVLTAIVFGAVLLDNGLDSIVYNITVYPPASFVLAHRAQRTDCTRWLSSGRPAGRPAGQLAGQSAGRPAGRTDGWPAGRPEGRTYGRRDGRTDGHQTCPQATRHVMAIGYIQRRRPAPPGQLNLPTPRASSPGS